MLTREPGIQAPSMERRVALPRYAQVTIDRHGSANRLPHGRGHPGFGPIPVERDEHCERNNEQKGDRTHYTQRNVLSFMRGSTPISLIRDVNRRL